MKFVPLPVLPLARVWFLLKAARLNVRRVAPVMRGTSSVEIAVFPFHNAAASTMTATTIWAKCFIPMGSVKRNATAHKMEKY